MVSTEQAIFRASSEHRRQQRMLTLISGRSNIKGEFCSGVLGVAMTVRAMVASAQVSSMGPWSHLTKAVEKQDCHRLPDQNTGLARERPCSQYPGYEAERQSIEKYKPVTSVNPSSRSRNNRSSEHLWWMIGRW